MEQAILTVELTEQERADRIRRAEAQRAEAHAAFLGAPTEHIKADSKRIEAELPDTMRHGHTRSLRTHPKPVNQAVPLTYAGLTGEWGDWLDTATRLERKIPALDRDDFRHDCLLELDKARKRDGEPLPKLRQFKMARLMIALYYREHGNQSTPVCLVSGAAKARDWTNCRFTHKPDTGCHDCPFRGVRPPASLNAIRTDSDGHAVELGSLIASDRLPDMPEQWYDLKTWLLGCPTRLIQIAGKIQDGITLTKAERFYLWKLRKRQQNKLF